MIGQCSMELLKAALAGTLSADEETSLNRHLEACEACGAAMDRMAGGEAWCREAAALLIGDELDAAKHVHDEWSEVDFTVEHLEPSDEANVLGRLGGYDVLEIIGRGGMGIVLKAFDRELKRCVAIKVLAPHLSHSSLAKKRFAREAQAAAAVVHPHVLAIHQVQPGGPLPFLVMPLVAGESLAERLKAQGPLEIKEILRIGMQAASGLAAAHGQGLVHRDVKPANILLETGVERAVLTDFGLARAADDVSMTRWGIIAGTPEYMSPEQANGEPLDGRSDLFSLGCVMYEMATGVSPFRTESVLATMRRLVEESPQALASLNPELPPWFIAIVDRLLQKDPSRRFASAAELSTLLEGCLAHVQQPASVPLPVALSQPVPRPGSWRRVSLFQGIIAVFAIVGFALLGWLMQPAPEPPNITGQWAGPDWGTVVLKKSNDTEYTGTYTDTLGKSPGEIQLKWSRIEGRFNGTWREGENRFGELSVRLVDNEIRGALTTDAKSKVNPATPRLADLTWVRAKVPGTPAPVQLSPQTNKPSPADALKRADIPPALLVRAGGGRAAKAAELVWIFGENEAPSDILHRLAVSPDGRWLSAFGDRTGRLWDMKTGKLAFNLPVPLPVYYAIFSPNSALLAAKDSEDKIFVWSTATGALQHTITQSLPPSIGLPFNSGLSFSPDGKVLSAFGSDGKLKRWSVDTWKQLAGSWPEQTGVVRAAFNPDGALVATMRKDNTVHVLKTKDGTRVMKLDVPQTGEVMFSPDGKTFVWKSNSRISQHQLWDMPTWTRLPGPPGSGPVVFGTPNGIGLHPTRRLVATTWSDDGTLRLWELVQGHERMQTFVLESSSSVAHRPVVFTPDGKYLAVAHYNGLVSVLRVPDALPELGAAKQTRGKLPAAQETKWFSYVDLQPKANQKLTDIFGGADGNDLASLPKGEQTLEKVKFKIGDSLLQLGSSLFKEQKPDRVEGIKVGKVLVKLHILHATQYGSGPGIIGIIADDTDIGKYIVHYEGGGSETIPVVYGKDVRNWWFYATEKEVTRGKVAWKGENEATKKQTAARNLRQIRLYLSTWENPHPAKKVVSIDYVKVGDTVAAPFCVAMTLEEK